MEESVHKKVTGTTTTTNKSYSRWKRFLAMCNHPDYHIVAHLQCPAELSMRKIIPEMGEMKSCFEIAHSGVCHGLFYSVAREHQAKYLKPRKHHPVLKAIRGHYDPSGEMTVKSKKKAPNSIQGPVFTERCKPNSGKNTKEI